MAIVVEGWTGCGGLCQQFQRIDDFKDAQNGWQDGYECRQAGHKEGG